MKTVREVDEGKINFQEWRKLVFEILTVMSQNEPTA